MLNPAMTALTRSQWMASFRLMTSEAATGRRPPVTPAPPAAPRCRRAAPPRARLFDKHRRSAAARRQSAQTVGAVRQTSFPRDLCPPPLPLSGRTEEATVSDRNTERSAEPPDWPSRLRSLRSVSGRSPELAIPESGRRAGSRPGDRLRRLSYAAGEDWSGRTAIPTGCSKLAV